MYDRGLLLWYERYTLKKYCRAPTLGHKVPFRAFVWVAFIWCTLLGGGGDAGVNICVGKHTFDCGLDLSNQVQHWTCCTCNYVFSSILEICHVCRNTRVLVIQLKMRVFLPVWGIQATVLGANITVHYSVHQSDVLSFCANKKAKKPYSLKKESQQFLDWHVPSPSYSVASKSSHEYRIGQCVHQLQQCLWLKAWIS